MNLLGSIRKTAASEVHRLRAQNPALRAARNPLWLRLLSPLATNRSLFRLLGLYTVAWAALVLAGAFLALETPQALLPLAEDLRRPDTIRSLLSYMLGAQATMVGLIFPLALGMVTLIVQRDEGAATNADIQLYYDQSLAYAVGTSGIALAIALVTAILAPETPILNLIGRAGVAWSISLALLLILGLWLLANLLVTWQFLITSLSFISPSYRVASRKRFVAARVIPRHLAAIISDYRYVQIDKVLFPGATLSTPFVMAGAAEGLGGDRAVTIKLHGWRQLRDVRLTPLQLAVRLWRWRCRNANEGPNSNKYDWMLGLAGPLGRHVRGEVVLGRRKGGVALTSLERWLIRRTFVFGAPVETNNLGPTEILEELADRVIVQIDRLALTGFDHALEEMREFHQFLLTAYTIIDENGVAVSYAAYGSVFAEHSNWVREYRRLFERAVALIEREDSFIGSLAHMAAHLVPDPKDNVPASIVGGLYEIPQYMVHRIGHWLTGLRSPRGGGLAALAPGALPANIAKAYRSVVLRIVGANESALRAGARYAQVADDADDTTAWATLARSWEILFKHIESAAYLIAASHWHEDDIGAELYAESFLQWQLTLRDVANEPYLHMLRATFLSSDLVDLNWQDVEAHVKTLVLRGNLREVLPAAVFSAIVANLHADVRVVTALVLAGWAGPSTRIYGAGAAAKRLANTISPNEALEVLDLVQTYVRLRIIEWSIDQSGYIGRLDNLVSSLDGMIERERVPGRVYSVDTRFRVGSLTSDWFVLVAALGDVAGFTAIEKWLSDLGEDEPAVRLGDENLWQLHAWLNRTASLWAEPNSRASLADSIRALEPAISAESAGESLHTALVGAASAIDAHRTRRLIALPIAPEAIAELRSVAAAELRRLKERIGLFPNVEVSFVAGVVTRQIFKVTGVDRSLLVHAPIKKHDIDFPTRLAMNVADRAARTTWKPYFKLRRRRVRIHSLRALFETAAEEGAKIAAKGARPILLMPTHSVDWPDIFDARKEMGDAVARRQEEGLPRTYLYSYRGVDFHRSALDQAELLPDDLLQQIILTAPNPAEPVEFAAKPETDPTDVTLTARLSVTAMWRDAEIVVLTRRARRASRIA